MANTKNDTKITQETLDLLNKAIENLTGAPPAADNTNTPKSRGGAGRGNQQADPSNFGQVLTHLVKAVSALTQQFNSLKEAQVEHPAGVDVPEVRNLQETVRVQGDEIDECRQRGMKGNLILCSPTANNKINLIKSDDQLREAKQSLTDHILAIVKQKYDVVVPLQDLQALHRLPNGNVILRLWNRAPGSAWCKLVDGIKSGKNMGMNFFTNFHLTKRRNSLLYEVRQLKKAGSILKFYTDENGQIYFRTKENGPKHKITYFTESRNSNPITLLNKDEIVAKIEKCQ